MDSSRYTPEELAEGADLALRSFTIPQDDSLLEWVRSTKKNNILPQSKIPLELVSAIAELSQAYDWVRDVNDLRPALCDMFVWGYLWAKEGGGVE